MIRVNPTKVSLKNEDLKEYEQVKSDWDKHKNVKKNMKMDVDINNTTTNVNDKKVAARQRIGLFEG